MRPSRFDGGISVGCRRWQAQGGANGSPFGPRFLSFCFLEGRPGQPHGQIGTLCIDAGSYRHEDRPIVGPVFDVLVWVQLTADFS